MRGRSWRRPKTASRAEFGVFESRRAWTEGLSRTEVAVARLAAGVNRAMARRRPEETASGGKQPQLTPRVS